MVRLPERTNTTISKLNALRFETHRGRTLAMSTIGDSCTRKLWLNFHWAAPIESLTAHVRNLFATGSRAEEFIIADLEAIGIEITDRQEEIWGFEKHARGFTDGRAHNVPEAPKTVHLLEMKTHNDRNFKKLQKEGVRLGFPKHYAQVQRYMGGLDLKRNLYVGYNKNTSEYYVERIRYDASFYQDIIRKEREIIIRPDVPELKFTSSWYECKFCELFSYCHEDAPPEQNCRTCEHVDLNAGGVWECGLAGGGHELSNELQLTGCTEYKRGEI